VARVIRRFGCLGLLLLLAAAAFFIGRDYVRKNPQDVPWTELDLDQPIGMFTARKLASLGDQPAQCRDLLADAGTGGEPVPARRVSEQCGYEDGIRLDGEGIRFAPAGLVTSCPVAAALALYERDVLQIAALRHFGTTVAAIDHAGSYSCRRLYNRADGPFSEHATADAIDVLGFRLTDGTRISVLRDWAGEGPKAAFLRDARDGACKLFGTVLSPDYNRAHADHLHFDQAQRGRMGWGLCR
jgi:hypothetical protein